MAKNRRHIHWCSSLETSTQLATKKKKILKSAVTENSWRCKTTHTHKKPKEKIIIIREPWLHKAWLWTKINTLTTFCSHTVTATQWCIGCIGVAMRAVPPIWAGTGHEIWAKPMSSFGVVSMQMNKRSSKCWRLTPEVSLIYLVTPKPGVPWVEI